MSLTGLAVEPFFVQSLWVLPGPFVCRAGAVKRLSGDQSDSLTSTALSFSLLLPWWASGWKRNFVRVPAVRSFGRTMWALLGRTLWALLVGAPFGRSLGAPCGRSLWAHLLGAQNVKR